MQSVVSGRASRRFLPIGSSQISQMPNVPSSIFLSARSSFDSRLFSRPRRRNSNDWRYSLEARSISSGRSLVSSDMFSLESISRARSSTALRVSSRSSCNFFSSFLFRAFDDGAAAAVVMDPPERRDSLVTTQWADNPPLVEIDRHTRAHTLTLCRVYRETVCDGRLGYAQAVSILSRGPAQG